MAVSLALSVLYLGGHRPEFGIVYTIHSIIKSFASFICNFIPSCNFKVLRKHWCLLFLANTINNVLQKGIFALDIFIILLSEVRTIFISLNQS